MSVKDKVRRTWRSLDKPKNCNESGMEAINLYA